MNHLPSNILRLVAQTTILLAGILATGMTLAAQTESLRSWILRPAAGTDVDSAVARLSADLGQSISVSTVIPFSEKGRSVQASDPTLVLLSDYRVVHLPVEAVPRSVPGSHAIYPNHRYFVPAGKAAQASAAQDWVDSLIGLTDAWRLTEGSPDVVVGIVDTGLEVGFPGGRHRVSINHAEDISSNGRFDPWPSTEFRDGVSGDLDGIDQDGNGFVDDVAGFDFVDQVSPNIGDYALRDPVADDEQGHGTQVGGIIGAVERGAEIRGIAPGVSIMPLRAFDADGEGEDDDIAAAIVYAADNGVDILNLSFGDSYRSPLLADAIAYARSRGLVIVASSGNNGVSTPHYPSDFSGVMSVGSVRSDGILSIFSGFGSLLSMTAPGEGVTTRGLDGKSTQVNGTSFAAPHVAAAAALLQSNNQNLTNLEISGMLESSAMDVGRVGWDTDYGAGVLNIARALERPAGTALSIEGPGTDTGVAGTSLRIHATATGPDLDSWSLGYGVGRIPEQFIEVASGNEQILNQLVAAESFDGPDGSTIVLRLAVRFADGVVRESRRRIRVLRDGPVISDFQVRDIWRGDRKNVLVSLRTDRNAQLRLDVWPTGEIDNVRVIGGEEGRTGQGRRHYLVLDENDIEPGVAYDYRLRLVSPTGTSTMIERTDRPPIVLPQEALASQLFGATVAEFPYGYLSLPRGDTSVSTLLLNRFAGLSFSSTEFWRRVGDNWNRISTFGNYVPRGFGETNGLPGPELLLQANGTGLLLSEGTDGDPFGIVVAADTLSGTFFPGGFIDIEGDGLDEIVGYRGVLPGPVNAAEEQLSVWRASAGGFEIVAAGENPTTPERGVAVNAFGASDIAIGNVIEGGSPEILVGDTDGDLVLYELVGQVLQPRWTLERDGTDTDKMIALGDVDGDGRDELIYAVRSVTTADENGDYVVPLWHLEVLRFHVDSSTIQLASERFYLPRSTTTFRAGIATGDLDGIPGDEVAVTFFPNLYVLQYDQANDTVRLVGQRNPGFGNDPAIVDVDGDGNNEIAVGDGFTTSFYRVDLERDSVPVPGGLLARSVDSSTIELLWGTRVPVDSIRIFRSDGGPFDLVGTTSGTRFIDGPNGPSGLPLESGATYRYRIASVRNLGVVSEFSRTVTASPQQRAQISNVVVLSPSTIRIEFDRALATSLYRSGAVAIETVGQGSTVVISSLLTAGDRALVVTFDREYFEELVRVRATPLLRDRSGALVDTAMSVEVALPARTPGAFIPLRASHTGGQSVTVVFNAPVTSAFDPTSIVLSPTGQLVSSTVDPVDPTKVLLQYPTDYAFGSLGYVYSINLSGQKSADGRVVAAGPGSIVGFTITSSNLSDVQVVPQPFRVSTDQQAYFVGLPNSGTIEIHRPDGEFVRSLLIESGTGGLRFDGHDASGQMLSPGVYLAIVTNGMTGDQSVLKFAVIP